MKQLFITFLILVSTKVYSIDFKTFEEYKTNNGLLANDITQLESLEKSKNEQLYSDAIIQYKALFNNYELLNSRLTLKALIVNATENGWKQIATKVLDLVEVCEGDGASRPKCLYGLKQLKLFVINSNLMRLSKESISLFIDNYVSESARLEFFDENFIKSFNENTDLINKANSIANSAPPVVVKITPAVKVTSVPDKRIYPEYILFTGAIMFFVGALLYYTYNAKKSKNIKKFYARIFLLGKQNEIKLRLFGSLKKSDLVILEKVDSPFLEVLKSSKQFAEEAHVKFYRKSNLLKIETLFFSKSSIVEFKNLQNVITDHGGEIHYSNSYNIKGEILNSKMMIDLPLIN